VTRADDERREAGCFLALLVAALLLFLALAGCAGGPEVRASRRPTAVVALRSAAGLVVAVGDACPSPVPWCSEARGYAGVLADGLLGVADALERGGRPVDVAVCLAPLPGRLLEALARARREVPPLLALALEGVAGYLPDCSPDD
jgi:hypothetical protein